MKTKAITGIMLTLLLIGMLMLAFNIQQVKAENPSPSLVAANPEDAVSIEFGETLSGSFDAVGEKDAYILSANASDVVDVHIKADTKEGYDGVYFPLGDKSFADEVVDFRPGEETVSPYDNPQSAVGPPDYTDDKNYVALGRGGILAVKFTDNYLIDVDGADLYVFEIGGKIEPFKVEISKDGSNWIDLGTVGGQPAGLDIHNKVAPDDKFSYVRITDANSHMSQHPYAGADIDAVGAIGVESATPGSAAIQLYPIADAYVNSTNPDMNYGSDTSLKIHFDSYTSYSYVMFDLSSIPSEARVTSASLTLYLTSVSGVGPLGVLKVGTHYCPDNSWTELGITWNNKPDFEPETTAVRSFGAVVWVDKYYSWKVTAHVTTALQQGKLTEVLKFEPYGEWGHHVFHSREETSKPYLEVEYTIPPFTSAISGSVDPEEIEFGQTVNVSGGISPPHGGVEVTLTYTRPNGSLITRSVNTAATGNYSDLYKPDSIGSWSVRASWAGEGDYRRAETLEAPFTVTKASPPVAQAGPDQTVDEDTLVTFDGSGSSDNIGVTSYTWTFMDVTSQTLTGVNPTYTFVTPGTYTVTLRATDAAGNDATATVEITVLDVTKPVADAGSNQKVEIGIMETETRVTFDAGGSDDNVGIVSYEWDFGDGTTGTGITTTHTYTEPGKYTVMLTVRDAAGNIDTESVVVTVSRFFLFPWWGVGVLVAGGIIAVATVYLVKVRKKPAPPAYPPTKPPAVQTCPGCGTEVKPEMVYCHRCGRKLR